MLGTNDAPFIEWLTCCFDDPFKGFSNSVGGLRVGGATWMSIRIANHTSTIKDCGSSRDPHKRHVGLMSRDALSMTVLNLNDGALAHVVLSRRHKSSLHFSRQGHSITTTGPGVNWRLSIWTLFSLITSALSLIKSRICYELQYARWPLFIDGQHNNILRCLYLYKKSE